MAFKNLADLYNEKVKGLYGAATMKFDNGKPSSGFNDDPLVVRKPGKGYWTDAEGRGLPLSSTVQDVKRLTLFTLSKRGILFLAKQQILQTGNTFESTRIINPAWILGNAVPFTHSKRAVDIPITLGGIGRQLLGNLGTKLFGSGKQQTDVDSLRKIGQLQQETYNKLSKGGANPSITSLLKKIPIIGQAISAAGAKRSIGEVKDWYTSRPELNGYVYDDMNSKSNFTFRFGGTRNTEKSAYPAKFINKYTNDTKSDATKYLKQSGKIFDYSWESTTRKSITSLTKIEPRRLMNIKDSLDTRYKTSKESTNLIERQKEYLKSGEEIGSFTVEQTPFIKYFKPETQGSITGLRPPMDKEGIRTQTVVENTKKISYMRDIFNKPVKGRPNGKLLTPYKDMPTPDDLTDEDPIVVSFAMGTDDHVQFRAFITDLQQSANPEYKTYQYIGRIEKFISYVSVQREISFKLGIIAFSKNELDMVWKRINYLTAMVFPYGVNKGILQPNIIRLTIGNVYYDQPGYITSLNTNFTGITETWDIDNEVPISATMDIKFNIIEKKRVDASSPFYHYLSKSVDGFPSPDSSDNTQTIPARADNADVQRLIAGDTKSLKASTAQMNASINNNNSMFKQPQQLPLPPRPAVLINKNVPPSPNFG